MDQIEETLKAIVHGDASEFEQSLSGKIENSQKMPKRDVEANKNEKISVQFQHRNFRETKISKIINKSNERRRKKCNKT